MRSSLMAKALSLAENGLTLTSPNPSVGCVIATTEGRLIGQGHTQLTGGPHAEIMALRSAREAGHPVRDATVYVTLEPCSHFGRTPPCCDALIDAGVARVVVAQQDPNPLVAGQGIARLRAAGVEVHVLDRDDPVALVARELNIGFFSRMIRKTPWLRMKIAASLDGKMALDNGLSQWITSEAARADGHAWRAHASAVLTGIGTVLADNPQLDVRLVDTARQPSMVVVDSRLRTPPDAHIFIADRKIYIYAAIPDEAKKAALQARGAAVIYLPGQQAGAEDTVDLAAMLLDLGQREINELHVEAGRTLNGALIGAGLVDELLLYLAPKLLGQGRDLASFGPLTTLTDALALEFKSTSMVGPDLRILARVTARDHF